LPKWWFLRSNALSDLILHQYADSPFSEKIRALLGYKQLDYQSVEIPAIMPKPDLTALTGGYRRTPVMQSGADIYCDTALIAALIETRQPEPAVLGGPAAAQSIAAARWTDSEFFRVCVGLVFQPAAIAANPRFQNPAAAEAFIKDRAAFTQGSAGLSTPLPRAEAVFKQHLTALESSLAATPFLGGSQPHILDFATWHCCWFVARQEVLRHYFQGFAAVGDWMHRMQQLSEASSPQIISAEAALEIARKTEPEPMADARIDPLTGLLAGSDVQVLPTDYGFQPVRGQLLAIDDQRISIARDDPRAGRVHVHFPRYGFEVSATGANE
jgi:glutathione S-transferase